MRRTLVFAAVALAIAGGATARPAPGSRRPVAHWSPLQSIAGVVDLSAPRRDGSLVVAAAGRLWQRAPSGAVHPFAPGYSAPPGLEPYIVLSARQQFGKCRFQPGAVYALRLAHGDGVTVVSRSGRVAKFAALSPHGLENGIAFDQTGRFGHRLLVTATAHGRTTVFAIDCRGRVQVLTRRAPRIEGGIVVAPASFGRFAGELIAPDEISGPIYAIGPDGRARLVVQSRIAHGQDVGVESEGFVPASFAAALVADRLTPGNPHPGDNLILALTRATLTSLGVHAGDLLAVSEGGAQTVDVNCTRLRCRARPIAVGPAGAHVEGHVTFSDG